MDARLALRIALDAWRAITRRQVLATVVLGLALFAYHAASGLAIDDPFEWLPTLTILVADQIKVWPILLAFAVVEHTGGHDDDRRVAYAMAAVLGTLVAAPIAVTFVSAVFNIFVHPAQPRVKFMVYIGLENVMFAAAILWIIHDRRRALRARARMHRAELERIAAEKRSVESDLQAMQARVEPQFLFNTLAQVKGLYERDSTRGEHMLDELIAYLRAAMPRMRDTASTVGQEIELARAYLAIVEARLGDRFSYAIDAAPSAYALRMPPMMLLPLVDDAIGRDADAGSAPTSLRIAMETRAGRIQLRVTEHGRIVANGARHGLAAIRERLAALYGNAAAIEVREDGAQAGEIAIDIPIEDTGVAIITEARRDEGRSAAVLMPAPGP